MARDPRLLDQNPIVIDPADVDAVLDDRPTPVSPANRPPMAEIDSDNDDAPDRGPAPDEADKPAG
ncbi:hypothetical protein [Ancylobacter terrae]|uniref:hypothetical protein n=1 Tax=Ancylobacter sp. sgz301288 TaxID=3342077 RepID=UPI00385B6139